MFHFINFSPQKKEQEEMTARDMKKKFIMFIHLFFQREKAIQGGSQKENPKQALHWEFCNAGLELMNQEIMTWAKTKSQMLNQVSHPGASMPRDLIHTGMSKMSELEVKTMTIRMQAGLEKKKSI